MTNCAVVGYKRHKPYYRWIQHDSFMKNCAVVGYKRHRPYYRWIHHDSFMTNCAVVGYKRHKPYYRWIQHDKELLVACASYVSIRLRLHLSGVKRIIPRRVYVYLYIFFKD